MTRLLCHLGVDPGIKGAWALLGQSGYLAEAGHFPIGEDGEIDAKALADRWHLFHREFDVVATVEKVGSMGASKGGRKQGVKGMFNFGRRYGTVLAVLQTMEIPFVLVEPRIWKAASGVTADKGSSLAAARTLWPASAAHLLTRVKDEARAEAALIARYGQRQQHHRRAA